MNGKYCDVRVRFKEKTFDCHRLILASMSSYFDNMFNSSSETISTSDDVVLNDDIDAASFEEILQHLYDGSQPVINASTVYGLFCTSQLLEVNEIVGMCELFIRENIFDPSLGPSKLVKFASVANNNSTLKAVIWKHIPLRLIQEGVFFDPQSSLNLCKLFDYARATNDSLLKNELCECIISRFVNFVQQGIFLEISYENIRFC